MIQFSGPTCSNCAPGYYGRLCEECPGGAREPCSGHGTCFDGRNGTGHCTCDENFTGKSCDHCVMGKTGDLCSKDINKCLIENGGCHANATCLDEGGKLTCTCMPGFYGNGSKCQHRCQIQNGGCHENATCSLKGPGNEITCICLPGFHGDGIHFCLSPCDVANGGCHSNATCNHENGEVTCTCMSGYLPLGDDCVSACHFENQNCHENATCHSEGPDNRVKCSCLPGFLGDGYHFCHNPCEIDNGGCHGDADCVVQDGHVVCACPVTKTCFDLCTYNNGGCHSNAECMDKSGSVTCSCLPGYHGDGYTCNTPCEILNGGCHFMATCSYSNSSVNCSCISNYIGDGYNCKSVCDIKNGGCHADASCQATPDGVKCTCYPGYHGDGYKCMSPCVVFNGGCHKYAKCSITNDFVSCVCLPGYYGSGYNCYSPCEINNHTCLPEAKCSFDQQKQSYRCKCPTNLTGDGVTYCVEDKCLQQNGGCPAGASCSVALSIDGALTTGHVQCTCKDDFVGNGTICNGDILDTLNRLNETQAFYKVLLTASSTSQELQEMVNSLKTGVGNTTVFVPYRISEGNFSQKALSTAAIRNHFVTGAVNLDADQFNNTTLVSLIGQQLKVQFKKQGFYVDGIRVIEANIPATNGIIHIIKQPLELAHISTQKVPGGELSTAGSSTTLIAELIGIIVASILVLAVLVLVYKFWWKKSGKVDILMRFRKEGGLFFERFTHLSEEEPQTSSSHVGENFDNPLYDAETQQVVLQ
ncbi:stabilin-2-like isoform X1 [Lingula anatina]|uniref:Stabilin-2-like isoform X1 n=1 Tax=Lingula anatina TaxID=7574 RepID=A0A1S3HGR1_LINAN|nr:stabilin-2-like isoform X1 [Lingula anatina]|eukprot:XP_013385273.1 stabilin-2-like isoform X1 [Lingula anatina]